MCSFAIDEINYIYFKILIFFESETSVLHYVGGKIFLFF